MRLVLIYINLCRGMKYLLKIPYFIQDYPNLAGFLISNTVFVTGCKHCPIFEEKYHKNERHFCLETHSFLKLSQNVCLINTLILMYPYDRYVCKLWSAFRFYCIFFGGIFIIIDEHSCLYQTFTDCVSD